MNSRVQDALTSLDEHGQKIEIIPAEVKGVFRRWRTITQWVLLFIFLAIPWTYINGNQTLLFDIKNRKFSLFGVMFWSHDGPLLFFVLAILALSLVLVTALWGRVWCGWACPQTVFIDGLYRQIEIWTEGNYLQRRSLRNQGLSPSKFLKTGTKWFLFIFVSSIIAHSFIAYFVGSRELIEMIFKSGPIENWHYFILVSTVTTVLLFNFGWFREQFCIIMCPYGRFQSVLLDSRSLTVLYDQERGEPRRGSVPDGARQGDCVACRRCVEVCPTGIDIRDGVQLECIACTACIDACNEIMAKVSKPKDLIRYASVSRYPRLIRPRTLTYAFFLAMSWAGLAYSLNQRSDYLMTTLRAKDTPYQILNEGGEKKVLNHFKLHFHNQKKDPIYFKFQLPSELRPLGFSLMTQKEQYETPGFSSTEVHFFILAPISRLNSEGATSVFIEVIEPEGRLLEKKNLEIISPKNSSKVCDRGSCD